MERVTTTDEFNEAVVRAEGPVLTLFYAGWCGYCQDFLPLFRATDAGTVKKIEVDISEEINPLWDTYVIQVVPTLILFEGETVLGRADGTLGKGLTQTDLDEILAGPREA
ncbi:MAG: thioredoxin family protein [Thermoplasmata archaeon]